MRPVRSDVPQGARARVALSRAQCGQGDEEPNVSGLLTILSFPIFSQPIVIKFFDINSTAIEFNGTLFVPGT